jgi:hypothetical protein
MNETPSTLTNLRQPSRDEISSKARELWENYGRPAGRDEEIWLEAERQLHQPSSAQSAPAADTVSAPASPPPAGTTARATPRASATATPRAPRKR